MSENSWTARTVDDLRSVGRSLERDRTRFRFRQLQVYAELRERGFESLGLRGLPDLIQADLACTRSAALTLARDVERYVGRNTVIGEVLDPIYPVCAGALAEAAISFEQARVIADVIDALPTSVQLEHSSSVEATLVGLAQQHDPRALKRLAERVVAHLDPDGPEPADEARDRRRGLHLSRQPDGSGYLQGTLTAAATAVWEPILAALAAQRPEDDLGPDVRTRPQRMHDAFEHAGQKLLRSAQLPDHAGLPTELLVTVELADLERRIGRATTHHGGDLSIRQALSLACEAKVVPVILDQELEVIDVGRGSRLATPAQRKALFARDRGCSFPGCTATAAQSQVHHMTEWTSGGPTDISNLTITCGYHNNEAPRQGWKAILRGGIPHWIPPEWRDPTRRPRRNWVHHPELLGAPPDD